ncbi:MAG: class I SAM-dependent methyltransferase [Lachnospiraceae bacterium]|nr:class I SAM-dependent methyltransferase [Lachnospiraceae bacterium]
MKEKDRIMNEETKSFLDLVYEYNPRQKSSIEKTIETYFSEDDFLQLRDILRFYGKQFSTKEIADAYNLIVEDMATETKYFIENGKYRYSSFEEAEKLVYENRDYMTKYMVGLGLSVYLWPNHIKTFHWFRDIMKNMSGENYLEIGPGHGRYFCEAVNQSGFSVYDAIDVSEASVIQTSEYVKDYLDPDKQKKCRIFRQNAYDYEPGKQYDLIVIAEVLEHLEKPAEMLEKLHSLGRENSYLYVTVPVNAPAIDHIYLFRTIEEVEDIVSKAGFEITDRLYAPGGDMKLERAIKRNNTILVGLLAKKV